MAACCGGWPVILVGTQHGETSGNGATTWRGARQGQQSKALYCRFIPLIERDHAFVFTIHLKAASQRRIGLINKESKQHLLDFRHSRLSAMELTEETKTEIATAYESEDRKASNVHDAGTGVAIAATLREAHAIPNSWGRGHIQLYLVCAIVYLCSTMNGESLLPIELGDKGVGKTHRKTNWPCKGYDGSLMGSINIMPEYQDYYHLGPNGSASTGIVFSIFNIGQMIGALFTWCNDWRGRKFMVIFGCVGVVACAIFTATAPTLSSFIGARFLLSFFSTLASSAAPLLLVEVAPPLLRGSVAGGYNTLYYMGSIIATFSKLITTFIREAS